MNKIQLLRLLRKNIKLSDKRSPIFEQNKWAKGIAYFMAALFVFYLLLYGIIIGMAADGEAGTIITAMIVILPIDFLLRFIFQTTPAMQAKPYIMLPISKYSVIECFLISSHISGFNFLWLGMFIPFSIIILCAGAEFWTTLMVLVMSELLIILNSQIYLFFRTLINRNVLWFLAALALYVIPYIPTIIVPKEKTFEHTIDFIDKFNTAWWLLPIILIFIAGVFFVNRHLQFKYVYEEISKKKEKELKNVSQFAFFERFGIIGEYLKIELKSNIRNKTMKQRCIMSFCLVAMFSVLIAYTDIYDNPMMTNFWCLYCFAIFGMTTLIKIMGQEGNYIDLLMTQKENILALLKAKYWFYSAVLIVPFVIMLPAVFTGKFTILMLFAYMLLMAGFLHFIIFQLAVYNKQTLPLDSKLVGKNGVESGLQLVIELVGMFVPLLLVGGMLMLTEENTAYMVMAILGLLLTIAHPLWLRNIYERMMTRKYENLEGFHASR